MVYEGLGVALSILIENLLVSGSGGCLMKLCWGRRNGKEVKGFYKRA